jgi:hypothetical protein
VSDDRSRVGTRRCWLTLPLPLPLTLPLTPPLPLSLPPSPGMKQPPRHCPHLVETPNDSLGPCCIDGTCRDKQSNMNVDFLG